MIDLWGEFGAPFDCHLLRESWPGSDGFGFVELKGRTGINLDLYFVCFFFWVLVLNDLLKWSISVSKHFPAKMDKLTQRFETLVANLKVKRSENIKMMDFFFGNWNETGRRVRVQPARSWGWDPKNAPKGFAEFESYARHSKRHQISGDDIRLFSPRFIFFSEVVQKKLNFETKHRV